jgi:hypothetical protein
MGELYLRQPGFLSKLNDSSCEMRVGWREDRLGQGFARSGDNHDSAANPDPE